MGKRRFTASPNAGTNTPRPIARENSASAGTQGMPAARESRTAQAIPGTPATSAPNSAFAPNRTCAGTGASFNIHSVFPSRLMETPAVLVKLSSRQKVSAAIGAAAAPPPRLSTIRAALSRANRAYTETPIIITAPMPVFRR